MASYEGMVGCGQQRKQHVGIIQSYTSPIYNKKKTQSYKFCNLYLQRGCRYRGWGRFLRFLHCLHLLPFLLSLHEAIRAHARIKVGVAIPLFRYSVIPYSAFYSVPMYFGMTPFPANKWLQYVSVLVPFV